jgi:hypothetical protein
MSFSLHIRDCRVVETSPPTYQVNHGNLIASLFGQVQYLADYRALQLRLPETDPVVDILHSWCASDDLSASVHLLTELMGVYVILVQEAGVGLYLYTGNEVATPLYWGEQHNDMFIGPSWLEILRQLNSPKLSISALEQFAQNNSVTAPNTFFKGLKTLKHYSLYGVRSTTLDLITHAFPGLHHVNPKQVYSIDDYLTALACYKPHHTSIGLAFSGGVDSRVLAWAYRGSLDELLTITQAEPYASYSRLCEREVSQRLARDEGLQYTDVVVNYEDIETFRPYFENFVLGSPFSSFLAIHYYHLAARADSSAVMTGQSGDQVWDWGFHQIYFSDHRSHSTSSHSITRDIKGLLTPNIKVVAARIASRYLSRYAMIHSFRGLHFERFIQERRIYGPEYHALRPHPYKMFILERAVNRGPLGGTTSWVQGANAAGKTVLMPYLTPLALHVASQIPRRNFFDMKAPLRRIYADYDSSLIRQDHHVPDKQPYVSSLFKDMDMYEPIQRFIDKYATHKIRLNDLTHYRNHQNMHEMHLYFLFRHITKQLEPA